MPIGATLGAGALGAGASIFGASQAADAQRDAAAQANALQQQMFATTQGNLQPFISQGQNANSILAMLTGTNPGGNGTGPLTEAFQPTMAQLQQTPGYQFTLDQGLKGVQNSAAAKGLGSSGAALKGAADYASGLAANTYQQQFQDYWGQNQNIYNMISGQSGQGLQAAGGLANATQSNANAQNANITGAANATAAAYNSMGQTAGNYLTGAGNTYTNYNLLQQMIARMNPTQTPTLAGWGTSSFIGPTL